MIGYGLYRLVGRATPWGLWYIVLGWMLGCAARAAVAQSDFSDRLEGITVADIMDAEPVTIPAETARRARLRGVLPALPGLAVVRGRRGRRPLRRARPPRAVCARSTRAATDRPVARARRAAGADGRCAADTPLEALLGSEPLRRLGALMAVDADGRLRGVVTLEQVSRALQARLRA